MNTRYIPGPPDAVTQLEAAGTTKTATFNGTALDQGAGYAPGGPGQPFSAVISTTALDKTDTNETYTATVQESSDNSTWTAVSPAVSIAAVGVMGIPVFISQRYSRVTLTLGGTTPSITYGANLVPHG